MFNPGGGDTEGDMGQSMYYLWAESLCACVQLVELPS